MRNQMPMPNRNPIRSRIARNPGVPMPAQMRAPKDMTATPDMMPPAGGAPMGMKKGGAAKSAPMRMTKGGAAKSGPQSIVGKPTSRGSAAKSGPENIKGKSIPKKKGGLAIMIAVGKPKAGMKRGK